VDSLPERIRSPERTRSHDVDNPQCDKKVG